MYDYKEYRKMHEIDFPKFESPVEHPRFMRGNSQCTCICRAKYPPRNALLIRPMNDSQEIYDKIVSAWRRGIFKRIAHGSCQQFIRVFEVKKELRDIIGKSAVSCVDVKDGSQLKKGDILLTRHGGYDSRSVGKPHLILEEK